MIHRVLPHLRAGPLRTILPAEHGHATARSHFRPMTISLMRAFTAPSERPGRLSDWRIDTDRRTNEGDRNLMARITVTTERSERPDASVLLDEHVCSAHLSDDHSAAQLIERLGWAINAAENAERRTLDAIGG